MTVELKFPTKERINKLLVDCGHAINANNGRCELIEDVLCRTPESIEDENPSDPNWRELLEDASFMDKDEEIVYNFSKELLTTKQVSDAAFKAVVDKFGERGAVDLTGVMGYYCFVSMMLNIDRYPLPDGEKPELKPLP